MPDILGQVWTNEMSRKLILSAIVLLGSALLRRLLRGLILTQLPDESPHLYTIRKATNYLVIVLAALVIFGIWVQHAGDLSVALGILAAGLAFALQKVIGSIAGMLPLGIAMEQTGAARLLAEGMVAMVGELGPLAAMAGLFILAALASQVMPNPAVAVLLAPIALNTASDLGVLPYPLIMTVAVSASAAFLSPVGHSANVLIMGPGGYRFTDYESLA